MHFFPFSLFRFLKGQIDGTPDEELKLDAKGHRTGDVWHIAVSVRRRSLSLSLFHC